MGWWKPLSLPGEVLTTDVYLDKYYSTYSPEKAIIFPAAWREESLPGTLRYAPGWKFTSLSKRKVQEAFVLRLPDGRVWGQNGAVITREGVLLKDLSREFGKRHGHSALESLRIGKPAEPARNIAVLSTAGGDTFYHWLFDILPRYYLLKKAGLASAIDLFVVPRIRSRFQQESLLQLGIARFRLLEADTPDFHIRAENLFVPSLPSLLGAVNPWASAFVREAFLGPNLPAVPPAEVPSNLPTMPPAKRLFISRKNAPNRRLAGEEQLEDWLERNGFTVIMAENHTLPEQAALFHGAEVVMAVHGSGLSNIVFCRPGTIIIELFASSFVVPCYWILANNHSLRYFCLQDGEETEPYRPYWEGIPGDCRLTEKDLGEILALATKS